MRYSAIIVDDEHLIRSSLTKKINELDAVVVAGTAENGVKCLQWLDEWHADICITDVRMPHMDGLELLRHINENYPWMASIVISSYEEFTYVRSSLQLNAIDYVLKPIDRSVLQEAINNAVSKLSEKRRHTAMSIVIKKLPHHEKQLDQWIEMARTIQVEQMYITVTDTLMMFEQWAGSDYYLLGDIAIVWIELLLERITKEKSMLELSRLPLADIVSEPIPAAHRRFIFRLVAVGYLEYGAKQLFEAMRVLKSQSLHPSVEQARLYLQEHYAEKINLQEVADAVAMSKTYLANLFKQETGVTIWNHLVEIRMKHARDLLLNSSLKSYEIAYKVGYENSIHFSRLFKEQYGLTPAEYKKRFTE
ncbi:response regulator [Paenibacillus sp. J5C_2022]|uniref:response regulator n=1 Tax=Paenibacillus sp. J5C2022 TaxID=2977129 RepID=UPI0021D0BD51|nr:response regulator [Paenibacillus sp. J5C2022]MCU6713116.1 response regulator [Paenibacillus sp. J5C2022]